MKMNQPEANSRYKFSRLKKHFLLIAANLKKSLGRKLTYFEEHLFAICELKIATSIYAQKGVLLFVMIKQISEFPVSPRI